MDSRGTSRLRPIEAGELIEDKPSVQPPKDVSPQDNTFALDLLLTALRALSQRALVALGNLWTLAAIASSWVLWYQILDGLPAPTVNSLIGASIYSMFVLASIWLRRKGSGP